MNLVIILQGLWIEGAKALQQPIPGQDFNSGDNLCPMAINNGVTEKRLVVYV